jgi:hypothetical protein
VIFVLCAVTLFYFKIRTLLAARTIVLCDIAVSASGFMILWISPEIAARSEEFY